MVKHPRPRLLTFVNAGVIAGCENLPWAGLGAGSSRAEVLVHYFVYNDRDRWVVSVAGRSVSAAASRVRAALRAIRLARSNRGVAPRSEIIVQNQMGQLVPVWEMDRGGRLRRLPGH